MASSPPGTPFCRKVVWWHPKLLKLKRNFLQTNFSHDCSESVRKSLRYLMSLVCFSRLSVEFFCQRVPRRRRGMLLLGIPDLFGESQILCIDFNNSSFPLISLSCRCPTATFSFAKFSIPSCLSIFIFQSCDLFQQAAVFVGSNCWQMPHRRVDAKLGFFCLRVYGRIRGCLALSLSYRYT